MFKNTYWNSIQKINCLHVINEPIENINAYCYIFLGLNEFCTACECFNPKTDKWNTKKCIKKKNKRQCSKKKVKENCMKTCFDQDVLIWAEVKYIFLLSYNGYRYNLYVVSRNIYGVPILKVHILIKQLNFGTKW